MTEKPIVELDSTNEAFNLKLSNKTALLGHVSLKRSSVPCEGRITSVRLAISDRWAWFSCISPYMDFEKDIRYPYRGSFVHIPKTGGLNEAIIVYNITGACEGSRMCLERDLLRATLNVTQTLDVSLREFSDILKNRVSSDIEVIMLHEPVMRLSKQDIEEHLGFPILIKGEDSIPTVLTKAEIEDRLGYPIEIKEEEDGVQITE